MNLKDKNQQLACWLTKLSGEDQKQREDSNTERNQQAQR